MRIQKLNYETKTNLLEDLLQRSPNQYTQYESRVLEILEHVKNEKDQAVLIIQNSLTVRILQRIQLL